MNSITKMPTILRVSESSIVIVSLTGVDPTDNGRDSTTPTRRFTRDTVGDPTPREVEGEGYTDKFKIVEPKQRLWDDGVRQVSYLALQT